jgi:alpha-N-acetylglucosaminidase
MLNTYWGGNDPDNDALHEYAYKEWAPMMESFYKPRWVLFFNKLRANLAENKSAPGVAASVSYFKWDRDWVKKTLAEIMEMRPENKSSQRPVADPAALGALAQKIMGTLQY